MDQQPGAGRRSLRRARQRGVQPRAGHPSRECREGLPGQSGRAGGSRGGDQQRQGSARLQREQRVLLAAESPGTLRGYCEVGKKAGGREGGEGREGREGGGKTLTHSTGPASRSRCASTPPPTLG